MVGQVDCLKELEQVDERFSKAETFRKKMSQWVVRQLKKCRQLLNSDKVDELPRNTEDLKTALTHFLDIVGEQKDEEV